MKTIDSADRYLPRLTCLDLIYALGLGSNGRDTSERRPVTRGTGDEQEMAACGGDLIGVARSRGSGLDSPRDSVRRLERDARNAAAGLIWRRGGRSGLAVCRAGERAQARRSGNRVGKRVGRLLTLLGN